MRYNKNNNIQTKYMVNSFRSKISVFIIAGLLLIVAAIFLFLYQDSLFQKGAEVSGPAIELPQTNPFEGAKTNTFKDIKTNPFDF